MKVSVVVPCYNEEMRLPDTLDILTWILPKDYEIVVSADGCTDRTEKVAIESLWGNKNGKVICSTQRLGKGGGILNGVNAASSEIIVVLDADLPIPACNIPLFVEQFIQQDADLLIGKRIEWTHKLIPADDKPKLRRLASKGFKWLSNKMFGNLPDTQCGFKIFRKSKIEKLTFSERGYTWDLELALKAKKQGWNIVELPVEYHHRDKSKVNVWQTTRQMLRSMVRLWLADPWRVLCLLLFLYVFGVSSAASIQTPMPIGLDYYFHLKIASIWASGGNGMFSSFVLQVNRFPYPPVLHWMLVVTLWLGQPFLIARLLQILFFSGAFALTMLLVSRHGGGAKPAALTGVVMLSCVDVTELIQVRPQALDMLLLPMIIGSLIAGRKKTFLLSSLASVYNHGIAALANLYLISIYKFRDPKWTYKTRRMKRTILSAALLVLPLVIISIIYFRGALQTWGSHSATPQERAFWADPLLYVPVHLGATLIGLVFLVKAVKNWRQQTELVKLLTLSLLGSVIMFYLWADRFLQYSILPLSCLAGIGLSKMKAQKLVFIGYILLAVFMFYMINYVWVTVNNGWWYPIPSENPWWLPTG